MKLAIFKIKKKATGHYWSINRCNLTVVIIWHQQWQQTQELSITHADMNLMNNYFHQSVSLIRWCLCFTDQITPTERVSIIHLEALKTRSKEWSLCPLTWLRKLARWAVSQPSHCSLFGRLKAMALRSRRIDWPSGLAVLDYKLTPRGSVVLLFSLFTCTTPLCGHNM